MTKTLSEYRTQAEVEKENAALKREVTAALYTIQKLLVDLNKKEEKISHLEVLVAQAVPVIKAPSKIIAEVDPELEIAIHQIDRLRNAAKIRTLTLEEIRSFDLLVKNKRLVQEVTQENSNKSNYRDVPDVELIKMLSSEPTPDEPK